MRVNDISRLYAEFTNMLALCVPTIGSVPKDLVDDLRVSTIESFLRNVRWPHSLCANTLANNSSVIGDVRCGTCGSSR